MSNLDFVQFRWQQIRCVEAQQIVERENVRLKKEIKEVKEKKLENKRAEVEKVFLDKLNAEVETYVLKAKAEIAKLKITVAKEVNHVMFQKELLNKAFNNLMGIYEAQKTEKVILANEVEKMKIIIESNNQRNKEKDSAHVEEMKDLKARIKELKDLAKNNDNSKNRIQEENDLLKNKIEELKQQNELIEKRLELIVKERDDVFKRFAYLEEEKNKIKQTAVQEKIALQDNYEELIEQLNYENQYLRTTVAQQEEQINRLSSQLIGNKSHFARYVEVKTENLSLQSQVETLAKELKHPNSKNKKMDSSGLKNNMLPAFRKRIQSMSLPPGALMASDFKPQKTDLNNVTPSKEISPNFKIPYPPPDRGTNVRKSFDEKEKQLSLKLPIALQDGANVSKLMADEHEEIIEPEKSFEDSYMLNRQSLTGKALKTQGDSKFRKAQNPIYR